MILEVKQIEQARKDNKALRFFAAIGILILSSFLFSGCGKKDNNTNGPALLPAPYPTTTSPNPTNTTPNPTSQPATTFTGRHLEDSLPGNSLLKGNLSTSAFQTMEKNLTGNASFRVDAQQSFDYTINPSSNNSAPQINRQDSNVNPPAVPQIYNVQAGQDYNWGRVSITVQNPPNINEPWHTFVFQYQVNVNGITLSSTDQVALFKAADPRPYGTDFLEVAYTTANPSVQRFRIAPMNPYQVGSPFPQGGSNGNAVWGSVWLHVVSQMISTTFNPVNH